MTGRLRAAIAAGLILTAGPALAQSGKAGSGRGSGTAPSRPRLPYAPYLGGTGRAPAILPGNNPRVRVQLPPRLDWEFALPAGPAGRGEPRHDSTQTIYQLWVPPTYRHAVRNPLLLFLSAKAIPDEWPSWDPVCRKYGVLFAVAYDGGDDCTPARRMRLALDVLDDIRRRMMVDPDRVYVAGLSEGARTACDLAYAYPEFVGGVIAIGAASSPRPEPWMRQRLKDRLSVALLTGQLDPSRGKVETARFPVLRDLGVQAKLWSVPGIGRAMPSPAVLEEALLWVDAKQLARKQLALRFPITRMVDGDVPPPELWAAGVVEEARARLRDGKLRDSGLLQLEGVPRRWPGTEGARTAEKLLANDDGRAKETWRAVYDWDQQAFYHLEAKALDAYVAGSSAERDPGRKAALRSSVTALWELVEKHGPDTPAGRQATARLAELRKPARP
jgi:predicted esterase